MHYYNYNYKCKYKYKYKPAPSRPYVQQEARVEGAEETILNNRLFKIFVNVLCNTTLKKKSLTAVATALTAMSRLSKSMFASSSNFWKSRSTWARFPGTLVRVDFKVTSNFLLCLGPFQSMVQQEDLF